MELKNNKSAWAALATLGVTAVAAGAAAIVRVREKRREQRRQETEDTTRLTPEQMMVYNEAVEKFLTLNERIGDLGRLGGQTQPLVKWLATNGEKPEDVAGNEPLRQLAHDIGRFLTQQVPFINAYLCAISDDGLSYTDCVRAAVDGSFDPQLDEVAGEGQAEAGAPIGRVLQMGYYFPDSTIAPRPVKSIVTIK